MGPKISIVIPAYNEEKYLPDCLKSIQEQDFPKDQFEIIVVDNNSTDSTPEVARKHGARVVGCQVHSVSVARQAGSQAATGSIIAGTDADTVVSKTWLGQISKEFADPEVVAITGAGEFRTSNRFDNFLAKSLFPAFVRAQFLFGKPGLNGFNFAIRKETFDKIGGFDTTLVSAEDVDLGIRAGKMGKVKFIPNLVVYTSARRIEKSRVEFFWHHIKNVVNFMILKKKPEGFENIR